MHEMLTYTAELKSPLEDSLQALYERVEEVIHQLDLGACRDAFIGDGLSSARSMLSAAFCPYRTDPHQAKHFAVGIEEVGSWNGAGQRYHHKDRQPTS